MWRGRSWGGGGRSHARRVPDLGAEGGKGTRAIRGRKSRARTASGVPNLEAPLVEENFLPSFPPDGLRLHSLALPLLLALRLVSCRARLAQRCGVQGKRCARCMQSGVIGVATSLKEAADARVTSVQSLICFICLAHLFHMSRSFIEVATSLKEATYARPKPASSRLSASLSSSYRVSTKACSSEARRSALGGIVGDPGDHLGQLRDSWNV